MTEIELGEVQERFADLIWRSEPIASGELVKLCAKELGWKKSTTYTVLRKLCDKGLFENVDGLVRAVVSKNDFYSAKSEKFVNESFHGSLPAFLSAFSSHKRLSEEEIDELQKMIDSFREGK